MKIYYINNDFIFKLDSEEIKGYEPIIQREITQDEVDNGIMEFTRLTPNGDDIGVDVEKKQLSDDNQALELSKQIRGDLIGELNYSEIHVSIDPPYPDDSQGWITHRALLRSDMENLENLTLSELMAYQLRGRPFGE